LVLIVGVLPVGCDGRGGVSDERLSGEHPGRSVVGKSRHSSDEMRFDLGVLQRGVEFRYCLPFSVLSLSSGDVIQGIKSSCSCVVVKEVRFAGAFRIERGLLVTVFPDKDSVGKTPTNLEVEIVLSLQNYDKKTFSVTFVESSFLDD
jgi:hypothetical protein